MNEGMKVVVVEANVKRSKDFQSVGGSITEQITVAVGDDKSALKLYKKLSKKLRYKVADELDDILKRKHRAEKGY